MNYKRIYNEIVNNALNRNLESGVYREKHHIIPKCMGGIDKDNIVELLAREHYICHILLVKIFPTERKLIYAANMMCNRNSKEYSWLKELFSENHHMKTEEMRRRISELSRGKKLSEEQKNNHSKVMKQKWKDGIYKESPSKGCVWNGESRERLSKVTSGELNPFFGKEHSNETKEIMRKKHWNKKHWKLISPKGEVYEFEGGISRFCKEHNLPEDSVKTLANKGIVQRNKSGRITPKRLNLIGWEIFKNDTK